MGVIGNTLPTLLDLARRIDPDGKVNAIAEQLVQTNEVLEDMQWKEGNLTTGEKTTVRTGLPAVTWRKLNYGVQPSKSVTAQITDTTGMLEAYAEVDKALADLNGNTSAWRMSEDAAFLESMNQTMAATTFYGDTTTNPERFVGLAPRFSSVSTATAASAASVIDAGGTGTDNMSVWLICWGPQTVYGIYPKGSKAGFTHEDLGQVTLLDANNGRFEGYRTHYKWDCGLTVRDWRYVIRIANIDSSDLTKNAATGADLVDLMAQAVELLPTQSMGKPVFYVNARVRSFLRRQIMAKTAYQLTADTVAGKQVISFDGIPVRRSDQLLATESRLV
jgi:hypothetical protein